MCIYNYIAFYCHKMTILPIKANSANTRSRILREKNAVWETETAFETVNIEFPCLKRRIHPNQSLTKL